MPLLSRWTIRVRLGVAFATVLTLMVVLGVFASIKLGRLNEAVGAINTNWLPSVDTAWEIAQRVTRYRTSEYRLLAVGPDKKQDALDVLAQDIERIETPLTRYAGLIAAEEERQLFEKVKGHWAAYKDVTRRIRELDAKGDTAAAQQHPARERADGRDRHCRARAARRHRAGQPLGIAAGPDDAAERRAGGAERGRGREPAPPGRGPDRAGAALPAGERVGLTRAAPWGAAWRGQARREGRVG